MRKKFKAFIMSTVVGLAVIAAPFVGMLHPALGDESAYEPTITASPSEGATVSLLDPNSRIYKATANYQKGCVAYYYKKGEDLYYPQNLTISWQSKNNAEYYNFEIGLKSDLSDATSYVTFDNSIELADLFVAKTYYYRITARGASQTVRSRIFNFKTAALPRTITVPGTSNTRDIGGYFTLDGKYQVKQGMFYRGGAIGADGIDTLLNVYGIKTDLDVRGDGYGSSPLGSSVNYVECLGPYYVNMARGLDMVWTNAEIREAVLKEIKTCAVKENYPIYLHCSLGRDRTGTLVFLINSLLGVGEKDLFMDFEISFMSASGTADQQKPDAMVSDGGAFDLLYDYMMNYSTGTLQENTEKFMLDLGISANEIASIREIMLEEI